MGCPTISNCTDSEVVPFDFDPDVAGIGVILGFLVPAWLTFIFLLVHLARIAAEDLSSDYLSRMDRHILKFVMAKFPRKLTFPISLATIKDLSLSFSDQQLITGAAILIVSYIKHCQITQYHFYLATLLADLSFIANQSIFLIVMGRFTGQPFKKAWRLLWVMVMFVGVCLGDSLYYGEEFLQQYGLPMQCVWSAIPLSYTSLSLFHLVMSICVYAWGLLTIVDTLYPQSVSWAISWLDFIFPAIFEKLHARYCYSSERLSNTNKGKPSYVMWYATTHLMFILLMVLFIAEELFTSTFLDIMRIYTGLFLTTVRITDTRDTASENGLQGNEDIWGFGQILAILVLALPIFQMSETIYGNISWSKSTTTLVQQESQVDISPEGVEESSNQPTNSQLPDINTEDDFTFSHPRHVDTEMGRDVQLTPPETQDASSSIVEDSDPVDRAKQVEEKNGAQSFKRNMYQTFWFVPFLICILLVIQVGINVIAWEYGVWI